MRVRLPLGLGVIVVALLLGPAMPAHAQVGLSAAVESNDIVRGVSLSDGRPTLSLGISYDDPAGAYGGLTLVGVDTRRAGLRPLGYIAYAGYAGRLNATTSWEVGVTHSEISVYLDHKYASNYTEIYGGFTRNDVSVHVYYSPKYIGVNASTLYVDVGSAFHPADHWRVFGHIGVLAPLGSAGPIYDDRVRLDLRAGVAREFRHFELHLAGVAAAPPAFYPPEHRQARTALVVGATCFF